MYGNKEIMKHGMKRGMFQYYTIVYYEIELLNLATTIIMSHLQNTCFVLKFKFQRNPSKFPIFIEKENPSSFFRFSF